MTTQDQAASGIEIWPEPLCLFWFSPETAPTVYSINPARLPGPPISDMNPWHRALLRLTLMRVLAELDSKPEDDHG